MNASDRSLERIVPVERSPQSTSLRFSTLKPMRPKTCQLSLEQEFKLQVLSNHIEDLDAEQLRKLLLRSVRQTLVKDNLLKALAQGE